MNIEPLTWSPESACLRPRALDIASVAAYIYQRTFRFDFASPGFCFLDIGDGFDSVNLRQVMLDLKKELAGTHESSTGKTLVYLSAGRLNPQQTTPPHLDGGPDKCFLMLGYEPSMIESELEIYDYSKGAFDHEVSPKEFMAEYNPMFKPDYDILRLYLTRIPRFWNNQYQIICINNSSTPYSESQPKWQENLHAATILTPDESRPRVVNSMMIASVPSGTADTMYKASRLESDLRTVNLEYRNSSLFT